MAIIRHESNAVYSKVVAAGNTVYTAGIVPADLNKDVKGQTAEVLTEIDRLLALCGTTKASIVKAIS